MNVKHPSAIYQLKVTLSGSKPPIWRRILVPSRYTLGQLHRVVQLAMGWENCHLHQFAVGNIFYGPTDDEFGGDFGEEMENEDDTTLSQVLTGEKDWLRYEYDFGDSWEHKIVLEKILPEDDKAELPRCVKGNRACPPEDCGGLWGYENLLDIIKDPSHEEHEDMTEWLGEKFDPEHFDLKAINEDLAFQLQ